MTTHKDSLYSEHSFPLTSIWSANFVSSLIVDRILQKESRHVEGGRSYQVSIVGDAREQFHIALFFFSGLEIESMTSEASISFFKWIET